MTEELTRLKNIIAHQLDVPAKCINSKGREREYVQARMMFANILMNELEIPIGRMSQHMNRDRTNFYHYKKQHRAAMDFPVFYKEYVRNYSIVRESFLGDSQFQSKKWQIEVEELLSAHNAINKRIKFVEAEMQAIKD